MVDKPPAGVVTGHLTKVVQELYAARTALSSVNSLAMEIPLFQKLEAALVDAHKMLGDAKRLGL